MSQKSVGQFILIQIFVTLVCSWSKGSLHHKLPTILSLFGSPQHNFDCIGFTRKSLAINGHSPPLIKELFPKYPIAFWKASLSLYYSGLHLLQRNTRFFMADLVRGPVITLLPGNGSVNGQGTNGAEGKEQENTNNLKCFILEITQSFAENSNNASAIYHCNIAMHSITFTFTLVFIFTSTFTFILKKGFKKHVFKALALWADAFYKSKCPSVCPSVCLSVCSLLRYHLTVILPPLPQVGCRIFLDIRNHWGTVMERSGLRFKHFFGSGLKLPLKKK